MGTKNNPGEFDCYANAKPDEPMFVLLGRDVIAGALVQLWADMRRAMGEDPAKVAEAERCAQAMRLWAAKLGKAFPGIKIDVSVTLPGDLHEIPFTVSVPK